MKRESSFALVLGFASALGLAFASPAEAVRIEKRQDRISRGIARQKHDGQTR